MLHNGHFSPCVRDKYILCTEAGGSTVGRTSHFGANDLEFDTAPGNPASIAAEITFLMLY